MSWNLLHSIFSKQKPLTIAAFTLAIWRFFFYLIENDTLKHKTTAPEGLHATICLKQIGTLWWNGVAVIFINEKLYWRKYVLIFSHSISSKQQAVSLATVNPFDHKQYVNEADKRQLPSKVSFMQTNTWSIRLFPNPVGTTACRSFPEPV